MDANSPNGLSTGITDYAIVGFTNYGGASRLRVYDGDVVGGWVDLADAVSYDDWTAFEILLTASALEYYVNGALAYTDATIGADRFSEVIMQAYNFADPAIATPTPTTVPYTAHWSNAQAANDVPEPGSLALMGLGLAGLAALRRRKAS